MLEYFSVIVPTAQITSQNIMIWADDLEHVYLRRNLIQISLKLDDKQKLLNIQKKTMNDNIKQIVLHV